MGFVDQDLVSFHTELTKADIVAKDIIGKGMVGKVYQGVFKNQPCAIKFYNQSADLSEFSKEVALLKYYSHIFLTLA